MRSYHALQALKCLDYFVIHLVKMAMTAMDQSVGSNAQLVKLTAEVLSVSIQVISAPASFRALSRAWLLLLLPLPQLFSLEDLLE